MKRFVLIFLLCAINSACDSSGKGTTTGNPVVAEDNSVSGSVSEAIGGALSGTSSNGSAQTMFAEYAHVKAASTVCPTFKTAAGAQCEASGSTMWLDYNDCSFLESKAAWDGFHAITMSSGTAACGTFPNPGGSGTLNRQYVTALNSTTPWAVEITSGYSTLGVIDDHTSNLSNFDNAPFTTLINGGYGDEVHFGPGGARTSVILAHRIFVLGSYDHSIYGSVSISETAGAISRTIGGSIQTYHNGLQVIGTSTFANVVHSDTCCLPISGTVTTLFSQGTTPPTAAGALTVGKSETLTFTGCGTGTLVKYDGTTQSVALSRCY